MGLLLVILGVLVWLFFSPILGLILIIAGLIAFFVPWDGAYGYSHYRRRPPP